jgi:hypothetical protein
MDYDFIEIGTSNNSTIIEGCDVNSIGISVEPISEYLQQLPNKPKVTKLNAAVIAPQDMPQDGKMDLYYVPLKTIHSHNLNYDLVGCNAIGKPHDLHTNYISPTQLWHSTADKSTLKTRDLVSEGLVVINKVDCITYERIMQTFQIGKVNFLKIDIEGYDSILVSSVLDFYENKREILPNKIQFETNSHTPREQVASTYEKLKLFGYNLHPDPSGHDTTAIKI